MSPLSISMTPAFYDESHALLRTQLKCLSVQTAKDFDVWLIDPHYQKRKSIIPELAARFKLDIKHIPYTPNTRIAKLYDCAIFNAAYCYSQAPLNLRYSCYRLVRPTLVETLLNVSSSANVDLYMHAVGPACFRDSSDTLSRYDSFWSNSSEDVKWDAIPSRSGYTDDTCTTWAGDPSLILGNWPPFMDDSVTEPVVVPLNIYGNIAWRRSQWFDLNGTNEVITNAAHWEDLDFDCRASNAKQTVVRYSHLLYRIHHTYGNHSQRSNIPVDVPFTPVCLFCDPFVRRNHGDADYGRRLRARIYHGAVRHYYQHRAWVCRRCLLSGPIYDESGLNDYFYHLQDMQVTKSPVIPAERIGRNLRVLAQAMDRQTSLQSKVETFNRSWEDPRFYAQL